MAEEIWEQTDEETPLAFEAFMAYLALGAQRSIRKAAEVIHGSDWEKRQKSFSRWSAQHNWVSRVRAWDRHCSREQFQETLKARRKAGREMADQHFNQVGGLINMLLQPAIILEQNLKKETELKKLKKLTPKSLMGLTIGAGKVFPSLMKAQRLAMGVDDLEADGLTAEEFGALVEELTVWAMSNIPKKRRRKAKNEFFTVLRRYGVRKSDTVQE